MKCKSVLDPGLVGMLGYLCQSLLLRANANAVWLLDERMQEIAHAGEDLPMTLELPMFAREVTGELLLRVGEQQVSELRVAVGLLVVVFDETSSLGLVRLHAREVQQEIERLVAVHDPGPMPPPTGSGGAGGAPAEAFAWPPAGRKRGSS